MTKYRVEMGGYHFEFDNGTEALNFADLVKKHFVPSTYRSNLNLFITLLDEEVETDE